MPTHKNNPSKQPRFNHQIILLAIVGLAYLGVYQQRYWYQELQKRSEDVAQQTQNEILAAIDCYFSTPDSLPAQALLFSSNTADVVVVELKGVKSLRVHPK